MCKAILKYQNSWSENLSIQSAYNIAMGNSLCLLF